MKKVITVLLASSAVIISSLQYASAASSINEYKCSPSGARPGVKVKIVGEGLINNGSAKGSIIFCNKSDAISTGQDSASCYSDQESLDSAIGRSDYTTLLTAYALGKTIGFYCNGDGWAQNIHIEY